MGKVEVVFSDPAEFKGTKAAQTFKRQKACCNDSLCALLFVANLACIVGLFADFLYLKEDGGFTHIEKMANATRLCTNETQVMFGLDMCETTPWKAATAWMSDEFQLVERDVMRNYDLMAVAGVIGLCLGLIWLQLLKRLTSCIVHATLFLVVVITGAFGYLVYHYAEGCLLHINFEGQTLGCVELQQLSDTETDFLRGAAYVIWGVCAVLTLCIILLKSKISLTVAIFEEACRGCLTNIGIYPVTLVIVIAGATAAYPALPRPYIAHPSRRARRARPSKPSAVRRPPVATHSQLLTVAPPPPLQLSSSTCSGSAR